MTFLQALLLHGLCFSTLTACVFGKSLICIDLRRRGSPPRANKKVIHNRTLSPWQTTFYGLYYSHEIKTDRRTQRNPPYPQSHQWDRADLWRCYPWVYGQEFRCGSRFIAWSTWLVGMASHLWNSSHQPNGVIKNHLACGWRWWLSQRGVDANKSARVAAWVYRWQGPSWPYGCVRAWVQTIS